MSKTKKNQGPSGGSAGASGRARSGANQTKKKIDPNGSRSNPFVADTAATIEFLQKWKGSENWVMTAIPPDGGSAETATFDQIKSDGLRHWIDGRQGVLNIYFTVNRTFRPMRKKPLKADIAAAIGLHVDVDPEPGKPLEEEQQRILVSLQEFDPKPTVIMYSGGGYQGFWIFEHPIVLPLADDTNRESRVAEIEDRNRAIAAALGADACHNIDRIMRSPETINVPGERKRAKGRTEALARIVESDWSRRYRLDQFPLADETRSRRNGSNSSSNEVPPLTNLDQLPAAVPPKLKELISLGTDPQQPVRWTDRSALVLHVLCELIRAGTPDHHLMAVILNPEWGVSAHVIERGGRDPNKYARRQIERALQFQPRPGPTLNDSPLQWAREVQRAKRPQLKHHLEEFLDWDGAAYGSIEDGTIRAEVWTYLESCQKQVRERLQPFVPRPPDVSAAIDALKAITHLSKFSLDPPCWLDGHSEPDPLALLSTRNGLLHLPTGRLLPPTPDFFTRNALDFSYDPKAPEPRRFLAFLRETWPDAEEQECVAALQDFIGYCLTSDTSQQKALLISGPKRSGKGTIGRVMAKLVGDANVVSPTLNSLGRGEFGLEPLLAKQLAIVSDMRLGGKTDEASIAENLLRITGEDSVSVNRKHRSAVNVKLPTRFVIMTNEVPKFADKSGVLVSRFIVLPMRQSFYGKEDTGLSAALMAELPGILNWAIEGWRRIKKNGSILQPELGRHVALQMTDLATPIPAFVGECCDVGGDHRIVKSELFNAFRSWYAERMGHEYHGILSTFAQGLYSAMGGLVKDMRPWNDGDRASAFSGIRLRTGWDSSLPI